MTAIVLPPLSSASFVRHTPAARRVCFEIPAASALTFKAEQASLLRVLEGRVWATRSGAPDWPAEDLVLGEGAQLPVARGERVVLESWSPGAARGAWFSWEPAGR